MRTPTIKEMASNFQVWADYVDPAAVVEEEKFEKMSVEEKVRIIESIFGPDKPEEDAAK